MTSTGAVTGRSNNGIYARARTNTTSLTISAATVSGGDSGIFVRNQGAGSLSVREALDGARSNNEI